MKTRKRIFITMLSVLMLCPSAQAESESTRDLINKLAESGRKQNWVLPTDCQEQQNAVRQSPYRCNGSSEYLQEALETPWVYRWGGKEDPSGLMTANELRQKAQDYIKGAEDNERKEPIYSGAHCDATIQRLTACAYQVAATKRSSTVPVSAVAAKAKLDSQCAPEAVASANKELQEVDRRVATFLESPAGQQTTAATPSLQVVMWGTREQARIMKQYCPDAEAFQEHIEDRMASFQSALQACQQIQSRSDVCGPVAP